MCIYRHEGITGSHFSFEFWLPWELDKVYKRLENSYHRHQKTDITGL